MTEPQSLLPIDHPWHLDRRNDLKRLLEQATDLFGCRVEDTSFQGVVLGDRNITLSNGINVFVVLDAAAQFDLEWARFNLAHECIHFLAPSEGTNYLEEGWASHFSLNNCFIPCERIPHYRGIIRSIDNRYYDALLNYEEFLSHRGNIKRLREEQPYISAITKCSIRRLFPECPEALIGKLIRRFE